MCAQNDGPFADGGTSVIATNPFLPPWIWGAHFLCVSLDSVGVLYSGAAGSHVRFGRRGNHNVLFGKQGSPKISAYPARARSKFGDGRFGKVHRAADITVGIEGRRGTHTAFALGADAPALLRKGAAEAMGGQLDFACYVSTFRNQGVGSLVKVNEMGHSVLSVVACGDGSPRFVRGPSFAASHFGLALVGTRPDISSGCLHLPLRIPKKRYEIACPWRACVGAATPKVIN